MLGLILANISVRCWGLTETSPHLHGLTQGNEHLDKPVQWNFGCTVIELYTGERGVSSVGSESWRVYGKAL